jgi:hypothetical protein
VTHCPDEGSKTSETSINFYQTRRRNIPQDSHLQFLRCESFKKALFETTRTALYHNSYPLLATWNCVPDRHGTFIFMTTHLLCCSASKGKQQCYGTRNTARFNCQVKLRMCCDVYSDIHDRIQEIKKRL